MAENGHSRPYKRFGPRLVDEPKVSLRGLPGPEEVAQAHDLHQAEDADRFTLYRPEQIAAETRDIKLTISFRDVIRIRDQAEMVIAAMQAIIAKTRQHDLGSVRQRLEARAEGASLGRALSRFNGKTPYGEWKPKKRFP